MSDFPERSQRIIQEFVRRFGAPPTLWVRAPGRADWIGSHTDYNEGFVLTMSIDRDTWIAARPRSDRVATIFSLNIQGGGSFSLDEIRHDIDSPWTDYVRGVARALQEDGYPVRGFDGLIDSTVPVGGGVSSSAALEVATAELFKELSEWEIDPVKLAVLCQRAENEFVGMRCGIMDQYSSVMGRPGHSLLIDCRSVTSRPVPVADGIALVLCDTRSGRKLRDSAYASRRADCEEGVRLLSRFDPGIKALRDASPEMVQAHRDALPERVFRRCLFVTRENQRVLDMAEALSMGDIPAMGNLLGRSYEEGRDLFEIVSPEMEQMVDAAHRAPGVVGARPAGAGFGGCVVAAVRAPQAPEFVASVVRAYTAATSLHPEVFSVRPSAGAGPMVLPA
jgi:galactokinase